uniref:16S rRNA (uracil(1498)-N(3))-methyltransferase n=1 Tax=Tetraselmis sp. GSL018 TaxID=582737 RepID=A0A061QUR2_9CHLO|mmetsp:Transcript_17385/g.41535  ORF Transcript_17385/g.41535 Transcript_17385/m.41535 type:complete len:194 (+) Transcript_17385:101-682(+)
MFSFYWQSNRKTLRNSGHIEQHIRLRKTTVCRNRILFRPTELQKQKDSETTVLAVGDERLNHIRNILKLLPGDKFKAGVLYGPRTTATVGDTLPSGETTIHFPNDAKETPLPRAPVEILLALPRPKVMNRLWPVLSSFGVQAVYITGAKKVSHMTLSMIYGVLFETPWRSGLSSAGPTVSVVSLFNRSGGGWL